MKSFRLSRPPRPLRTAQLDNLALVPGSVLASKCDWQARANALPPGTTLVVLPVAPGPQRATLEKVVVLLRAKGRRVAVVPVTQLAAHGPPEVTSAEEAIPATTEGQLNDVV